MHRALLPLTLLAVIMVVIACVVVWPPPGDLAAQQLAAAAYSAAWPLTALGLAALTVQRWRGRVMGIEFSVGAGFLGLATLAFALLASRFAS